MEKMRNEKKTAKKGGERQETFVGSCQSHQKIIWSTLSLSFLILMLPAYFFLTPIQNQPELSADCG